MKTNTYNPDVLNCLANLSNDEVFTPPSLANQVLDLLPKEVFTSPETTFLDPVSKSGVFLREIVKRLDRGLEPLMPNRRERIEHILKKQVFGIAITELTSHLSRRSVYCSKDASSEYSVTRFATESGNILYRPLHHTWQNGKCRYCGASQDVYDRGNQTEQYAYQFIHTDNPHKLFNNMKFDVIIGNPPYQLEDGGNSASAKPIYHFFVEQAKKLSPRFLCMIIPSRWFTGGKGLDAFRDGMLNDSHIKVIKDYANSKDCFPGLSVSGGICYFLWDKEHSGLCDFTTINSGKENRAFRKLNEFSVFVRYNAAVDVIHKVKRMHEASLMTIMSSRNPFGIPTNVRGLETSFRGSYKVISSKGEGFVGENEILTNKKIADKYKIMVTRIMSEHAGEPDKNGQLNVLATIRVLYPKEVCTDSYIVGGVFDDVQSAENMALYLKTRFVRFLLLQAAASINLSKTTYAFVPLQDFSHPWTDEMLYKKYGLTDEEIAFIESMIRPME